MKLPAPHVIDWSQRQKAEQPRAAAEIAAPRGAKPSKKPEAGILKAEPVSIGTAILAFVGITGAPTAVAFAVGAVVLTSHSRAISFNPTRRAAA